MDVKECFFGFYSVSIPDYLTMLAKNLFQLFPRSIYLYFPLN